jgi:hypothetical protein
MPFVPKDKALEQEALKGPHLALLTDEGFVGIPEGAHLWLVEDASRMDRIFPMVLAKVSHESLVFAMRDADGGVSEYRYRLVSGKPKNKAALERMLKNGTSLSPSKP